MTHTFTCDWCHEPIDSDEDAFVQLQVLGSYGDGGRQIRVFRDFHAGARGDDASCLARVLRLLDGGSVVDGGLVAGWDARTHVDELDLPSRVVRTLRAVGVETVAQLHDHRALGRLAGVRGIGAKALTDIDRVLVGARGDRP